jgi:hypothetical protein
MLDTWNRLSYGLQSRQIPLTQAHYPANDVHRDGPGPTVWYNSPADIRPTERVSKVTSLVAHYSRGSCVQHLHEVHGPDAHRTQILSATFAWHTNVYAPDKIHARYARHICESDANVARNKGCYIWTPLYFLEIVLSQPIQWWTII